MRVLIEKGDKTVDLEDADHMTSLLQLVLKALKALDYTEEDIKRFLEDE